MNECNEEVDQSSNSTSEQVTNDTEALDRKDNYFFYALNLGKAGQKPASTDSSDANDAVQNLEKPGQKTVPLNLTKPVQNTDSIAENKLPSSDDQYTGQIIKTEPLDVDYEPNTDCSNEIKSKQWKITEEQTSEPIANNKSEQNITNSGQHGLNNDQYTGQIIKTEKLDLDYEPNTDCSNEIKSTKWKITEEQTSEQIPNNKNEQNITNSGQHGLNDVDDPMDSEEQNSDSDSDFEIEKAESSTGNNESRLKFQRKIHSCPMCEYKTSNASSIKQHIRTHTGEKPFGCHLCNYKSTKASNLKKHLRTHTGEKPYSCDVCDYKATQIYHLRTHYKTHTGEKPYECDICDFKAVQYNNLKLHILTHTGEKPFKCELCDYRTSFPSSLKRHMQNHNGQKPYKCHMCDYTAAQAGRLQHHLLKHCEDKQLKCKLCNYQTVQEGRFKQHMLKHSGAKPFQCHVCNYKSSQAGRLKRHIEETHTGGEPYDLVAANFSVEVIVESLEESYTQMLNNTLS